MPVVKRWLHDTFAALAVPSFRMLWTGTLFSFVAFFMSTVVQSVVAFRLTGSNSAVGFVVFGQGLAMFVLGPFGGAFADRWSKRRVIATCQLVTTSVFFALAALVASDLIHVAFLAIGSFMMGATFAFQGPTRQAFVVELVPENRLGNAVALSQVANSASRAIGPALAGVLLAWTFSGATGAYLAMGCFYLLSLLTLLQLPSSRIRANVSDTHVFEDILAGLRYVRDNSRLRGLVSLFILVVMFGFPHVTLLPGFVENELGRPAESISLLFGLSALASLGAGLAVARRADSPAATTIYVSAGFGFGLSLLVLAWSPSFEIAVAAMLLVGATSGAFQTLSGAVVIRQTEPVFVGRVMSLTLMAFGGFGLVALPVGFLGDFAGERTALVVLGVLVCAIVAWFKFALRGLPDQAARRAG